MKKNKFDPNKLWFLSDTHFGHSNIIKYCSRPFANADVMDAAMIDMWNDTVQPDDQVWHLGDFAFGPFRKWADIIAQLNGNINLVRGNHDHVTNRELQSIGIPVYDLTRITVDDPDTQDGQHIVLCHYAMRVWDLSHRGSWHLYGHSHGGIEPHGLSFDVGVDPQQFKILSYYDVKKQMEALMKKQMEALMKQNLSWKDEQMEDLMN